MGICFSEPPVQQATVVTRYPCCRGCGNWVKNNNLDYCEMCLQKNAMSYIQPSAPPLQPQYTYAVQYPQQVYYPPQQTQQLAYISTPYPQYPPQQRQIGTGTAVAGGFLLGAMMEEMMDPN